MEIAKAKEYFRLGLLAGAEIRGPDLLNSGFTAHFAGKNGAENAVMHTARGQVRQFKTLDAAAAAVADVGFKKFGVTLA